MMSRSLYPKEWGSLAREAKERAGWMGEVCLVSHGALVRSPRTGNHYIIYLQAAHVHHDQENPHPLLKAVCPTCHARYYRRPKPRKQQTLRRCRRLARLNTYTSSTCTRTHGARQNTRTP